jgi:DnaJ-class molecular chaperone
MSDHQWAMAHLVLAEQRRRFDFRTARVCRACQGRGKRRKVLWWRGWKLCRVCHGRAMLGGH